MRCRNLLVVLVGLGLAAGCAPSPTTPSSKSSTSSLVSASAATFALSQAVTQVALAGGAGAAMANTLTIPCASGGTIVMTLTPLQPPQANAFSMTSRLEFHECVNQTVALNGDPYLESAVDMLFSSPGTTNGDATSTLRTTGGLRSSNNGVEGRVQMNCTTTASLHIVNGVPQISSMTSTGTVTVEQPIGATPVEKPCGG